MKIRNRKAVLLLHPPIVVVPEVLTAEEVSPVVLLSSETISDYSERILNITCINNAQHIKQNLTCETIPNIRYNTLNNM